MALPTSQSIQLFWRCSHWCNLYSWSLDQGYKGHQGRSAPQPHWGWTGKHKEASLVWHVCGHLGARARGFLIHRSIWGHGWICHSGDFHSFQALFSMGWCSSSGQPWSFEWYWGCRFGLHMNKLWAIIYESWVIVNDWGWCIWSVTCKCRRKVFFPSDIFDILCT